MKVHIEILTAEGATVAAKVAAAIAGAMNGEASVTTRTRRTKAEIEADATKAAAETKPPVDAKPDAAALYESLSGKALPSSEPDTAKTPAPTLDTASVELDPLEAALAGATATVPAKSREDMIAAITKLMGEKGVVWTRENIIGRYKAAKFSEMSDELVTQIYTENCV